MECENYLQDLKHWSLARLEGLAPAPLDALTRRVVGQLTQCRVLLGRCLLAIDATDAFAPVGCSSSTHYAVMLGLDVRTSRESRRVARCLEELPLLREAAEEGSLGWSVLREITHKATPETEERWLDLAWRYNYSIIERLVKCTEKGQRPGDPDSTLGPELVECLLQLRLPALVMAMFERVLRMLCDMAGRRVSQVEGLECLCADFLAGSPFPAGPARERLHEEARKDLAARSEAESRQVEPVRVEAEATRAAESEGPPVEGVPEPIESEQVTETAPWEAVAAREHPCPSDPTLKLVRPGSTADWQNERLRFSDESRFTTDAQRRELHRRDAYCCATPGCPNRLWLAVHHIVFYCRGGLTIPSNLVMVCSRCHRNLHRGLLRVTGTAPAGLHWTDRYGRSLQEPFPLPLVNSG